PIMMPGSRTKETMKTLLSSFIVLITFVTGASALALGTFERTQAQTGKTAAEGVYWDAQSERGQALADKQCATCHGDKLTGTALAPPLSGQDFLSGWNDRTLADLNDKIQTTMPADAAGSLTPQ